MRLGATRTGVAIGRPAAATAKAWLCAALCVLAAQASVTCRPRLQVAPPVPSAQVPDGGPASDSDAPANGLVIENPPSEAAGLSGRLALPGTTWLAAGVEAQYASITFSERFVTLGMIDGSAVTVNAEFGAVHPACLGYPLCVFTVDGAGRGVPFFFGAQDELLFLADCTIDDARAAAVRDERGGMVIWEQDGTLCWNLGLTPYERRVAPGQE